MLALKLDETSGKKREALMMLFLASEYGCVELVDEALEKFEQVENSRFNHIGLYVDDEGLTALMRAAKHGKEETVRRLLEAGASGYHRDKRKRTALMWGVLSGNPEVVRLLVSTSNVNDCDDLENEPLFYALEGGKAEIVRLLLENKASTTHVRYGVGGVVAYAIRKSTREVVEFLIEAGQKLNGEDGKHGDALHEAIVRGDVRIVAKLLERGANPNLPPLVGMLPVQIAMFLDEPELICLLLDAGACAGVSLPNGETLREWATRKRHGGILAWIQKNDDAKEKLDEALLKAAENASADLVELLVQAGSTTEKRDAQGRTPLLVAAEHGDVSSLKILIQHGANVNQMDFEGQNALHIAIRNSKKEAALALLESDIDINKFSQGGLSPLMWAAARGEEEILRRLIEKGAELDIGVDERALSWAVLAGQTESVRILLNAGAELNKKGERLLMKAIRAPMELIKLLMRRGLLPKEGEFKWAKILASPEVTKYLESVPMYEKS